MKGNVCVVNVRHGPDINIKIEKEEL